MSQKFQPQSILIIPIGMVIGTSLFLAFLGYQYILNKNVGDAAVPEAHAILKNFFFVMWLVFMALSYSLPKMMAKNRSEMDMQTYLQQLILKYALLEAPALFGLVVIMLSIVLGSIHGDKSVLLCLLGYGGLVLTLIRDWPDLLRAKEKYAKNLNSS